MSEQGDVIKFMPQVISLDYIVRTAPVNAEFGRNMQAGRVTGHKCPQCARVYVPPKGFCPICVVETSKADEVPVTDRGVVTSWTVLTPIQYHGQNEREDYALASILLDGASGTIGQQRLLDVPLPEIRMGMRVEAVWAPEDKRNEDDGRGWGFGSAITGFKPTGEPDAGPEIYEEHQL
ncbi:MAG: uncharacterized protein QOH79_3767 [Acidimicrobiaceae bacterium]|jgi:uncharacterized OB-fold protein